MLFPNIGGVHRIKGTQTHNASEKDHIRIS